MTEPEPHICTCGECEVEHFGDKCKYELKVTFYEGLLQGLARQFEQVGMTDSTRIMRNAIEVKAEDLLACAKEGMTAEQAVQKLVLS